MGILSVKFNESFKPILNTASEYKALCCSKMGSILANATTALSCVRRDPDTASAIEQKAICKALSLCNAKAPDFETEFEPILNQIRIKSPYLMTSILGRTIEAVKEKSDPEQTPLLQFLESKKQEASSQLASRPSSYFPKAAVLLALPILAALAWSLKSAFISAQIISGPKIDKADPDLLKTQLTHSSTVDENAVLTLTKSEPFLSGSGALQDMQKSLLSDESSSLNGTECLPEMLHSWETAGFSPVPHDEKVANSTHCPTEVRSDDCQVTFLSETAKENIQVEDLRNYIDRLDKKENYREAFEAVIAASDWAVKEAVGRKMGCSPFPGWSDCECPRGDRCDQLMNHSKDLILKFLKKDLFIPEIMDIARKWTSVDIRDSVGVKHIWHGFVAEIAMELVHKEKYLEAFELADRIFSRRNGGILRELIKKDVLLFEVFDLAHKRYRLELGNRDCFRDILAELFKKGIGLSELIDLYRQEPDRFMQSLKIFAETPEGMGMILEMFAKDQSLQNRAVDFFRSLCDSKEECPQAAVAIRKLLPAIKDPKIVQELETLITPFLSTRVKRLFGFR